MIGKFNKYPGNNQINYHGMQLCLDVKWHEQQQESGRGFNPGLKKETGKGYLWQDDINY